LAELPTVHFFISHHTNMTPTTHYVFGYGSLICSASRALSAPSLAHSKVLPCRIHNVVRTWNKRSLKSNATYLGVQEATVMSRGCVGVLIPLHSNDDDQVELQALDKREQGYDRQAVPLEWIERVDDLLSQERTSSTTQDVYRDTFLDDVSGHHHPSATVWMYVPQQSHPPTASFPIVQSYLDICVRGCLDISEPFLQDFLASTIGWDPLELELLEDDQHMQDDDGDGDDDDDDSTQASTEGWYHSSSSSSSSLWDMDTAPPRTRGGALVTAHTRTVSDLSTDSDHDVQQPQQSWINDRRDPLYMRADKTFSLNHATKIDALLQRAFITHKKRSWNALRITRGKKEIQSLKLGGGRISTMQ
jgi:cation transport regulator ChaC